MIEFMNESEGSVLILSCSGKITTEDYDEFIQRADEVIRNEGELNVVMDMTQMSGLEVGVIFQDLGFTFSRLPKFNRLAVVGDQGWNRWIARVSDYLPGVEAQCFGPDEMKLAHHWAGEQRARKAA